MAQKLIPTFDMITKRTAIQKTILVIDDEQNIRELLRFMLESRGYSILMAKDAGEAMIEARKQPALILLDVSMPVVDGWQLAKMLKEHPETSYIPIIFITALRTADDEVMGFEVGATDYITKPIHIDKLVARISAALKTAPVREQSTKSLRLNRFVLDAKNYTVVTDATGVQLSKKEFEVLYFLAANPNRIISRRELIAKVWGETTFISERTIDVHIRQIRKKIGNLADCIETLKGIGYRLIQHEAKTGDLRLVLTSKQA